MYLEVDQSSGIEYTRSLRKTCGSKQSTRDEESRDVGQQLRAFPHDWGFKRLLDNYLYLSEPGIINTAFEFAQEVKLTLKVDSFSWRYFSISDCASSLACFRRRALRLRASATWNNSSFIKKTPECIEITGRSRRSRFVQDESRPIEDGRSEFQSIETSDERVSVVGGFFFRAKKSVYLCCSLDFGRDLRLQTFFGLDMNKTYPSEQKTCSLSRRVYADEDSLNVPCRTPVVRQPRAVAHLASSDSCWE